MTLEELKSEIEDAEKNWRMTIGEAKDYYKNVCDRLYAQREALEKNEKLTRERLN